MSKRIAWATSNAMFLVNDKGTTVLKATFARRWAEIFSAYNM